MINPNAITLNPAIMHIAATHTINQKSATDFRSCVSIRPQGNLTEICGTDGHRAFLLLSELATNRPKRPFLIHSRPFRKAPPAGATRLTLDVSTFVATYSDDEDGRTLSSFSFDVFEGGVMPQIATLFPDDWQFKGHSPVRLNPGYFQDALAMAAKYSEPCGVDWYASSPTTPCMISFTVPDCVTPDVIVPTRARILIMPLKPLETHAATTND